MNAISSGFFSNESSVMPSADFHPSDAVMSQRDSDPRATLTGQLISSRKTITLWSTLGIAIALAGLCTALAGSEQRRIRSAAETVIAKPLERVAEVNAAFHELQALDAPPCSATQLAALRSIAFRSAIIRDVIFRGDNAGLRCSGNLGSEASKLPSKSPDFTAETGRRIWRNVDLALSPGVKSTLVQEGSYELLVAPENQPLTVEDGYYALSVVLLNRANRTMLVLRGLDPGIEQPLFASATTTWLRGDLVSIACLPGKITCYVLKAYASSLLMSNLMLLILTGILAGIGTAAGVASWLARKFRTRTIDALLREAVRKDELFMHYQPIVDNRTGETVSAECLHTPSCRSSSDFGTPDMEMHLEDDQGSACRSKRKPQNTAEFVSATHRPLGTRVQRHQRISRAACAKPEVRRSGHGRFAPCRVAGRGRHLPCKECSRSSLS